MKKFAIGVVAAVATFGLFAYADTLVGATVDTTQVANLCGPGMTLRADCTTDPASQQFTKDCCVAQPSAPADDVGVVETTTTTVTVVPFSRLAAAITAPRKGAWMTILTPAGVPLASIRLQQTSVDYNANFASHRTTIQSRLKEALAKLPAGTKVTVRLLLTH